MGAAGPGVAKRPEDRRQNRFLDTEDVIVS